MKVCLDPGHGGHDSGGVGNGMKEKDLVLSFGLQLACELRANNIAVKLTRTDDTFISIGDRYRMANQWKADVFVSLHTNAAGGQGFETWWYKEKDGSKNLSHEIQKRVVSLTRLKDRGIKWGSYIGVIKNTKMPSCLTESGFIDNTHDATIMKDPAFWVANTEAHAAGICAFAGWPYPIEQEEEMSMGRDHSGPTSVTEWWTAGYIGEGRGKGTLNVINRSIKKNSVLITAYYKGKENGDERGWDVPSLQSWNADIADIFQNKNMGDVVIKVTSKEPVTCVYTQELT